MQRINKAIKLSEVSSEVTFQLPLESSSQFKDFFYELDQSLSQLGVRSYGVGVTTLEEVFLRVAKSAHDDEDEADVHVRKEDLDNDNKGTYEEDDYSIQRDGLQGSSLVIQHFVALVKKRWLTSIRAPRTLFVEMALPVVLMVVGMILSKQTYVPEPTALTYGPTLFSEYYENSQTDQFFVSDDSLPKVPVYYNDLGQSK